MNVDKSAAKENFSSPLKSRYKVEMCRNWADGFCEFGNKCTFAHGEVELKRANSPAAADKPVACANYKQKGYCFNGSTCKFAHRLMKSEKFTIFDTANGIVTVFFVDLEDRSL